MNERIKSIGMQNVSLEINQWGKVKIVEKKDITDMYLSDMYDPEATCPKWDRYLKKLLPRKRDRKVLAEFMGYCLLPSNQFEKFLVLDSGGYRRENARALSNIIEFFYGGYTSLLVDSQEVKVVYDRSDINLLKIRIDNTTDFVKNIKMQSPIVTPAFKKPKQILIAHASNLIDADENILKRMLVLKVSNKRTANERMFEHLFGLENNTACILNFALKGLKRLMHNVEFTDNEKR